jgi:hypothetical protein
MKKTSNSTIVAAVVFAFSSIYYFYFIAIFICGKMFAMFIPESAISISNRLFYLSYGISIISLRFAFTTKSIARFIFIIYTGLFFMIMLFLQ